MRGIHVMPFSDYLSDPCPEPSLTRGTIHTLVSGCPARAWYEHPRLNPDYIVETSKACDIGAACHSLLLEGCDKACPIEAEDWRTKSAKLDRELARSEGKIPLLRRDYDRVTEIVKAAERQLEESELGIVIPRDGQPELTYIWQEGETWFRCRPDWISTDKSIILDAKFTAQSADPALFGRNIDAFGYDIQDAFYRRGVEAIDGGMPKFFFFVVEVNPPYLASIIALDPQYRELGEQKVELGIQRWRKYMASNEWPGYPKRVCYVEPKPWTVANWQEQQFSEQLQEQGKEIPF